MQRRTADRFAQGFTESNRGVRHGGDGRGGEDISVVWQIDPQACLTVRQIAKTLTLERIPTPVGAGQWHWSTVDRILREEAYIGTYYYNRKHCVAVDDGQGKKRQRYKCTERPREEWIPISVPPIIDLETFHKAAGRSRDNQAFAPRNLKEDAYLLRKLVRCGRCGSSCSAITSKQVSAGHVHTSHYYVCLRKNSGFLKQERCGQRQIRADVLDEMVWEDVSVRLQDPKLVYDAYQECQTHRSASGQSMLSEPDHRVEEQIKSANKELSRLLDAYQCGAIELTELQKRRKLIDSKLELLTREKEMLAKMAEEQEQNADIQMGLEEFATLVSNNLRHISFENRQKLLRTVLDKVVVKDWRVDVYYNIPLPKPNPTPNTKVSSKFSLCSTSRALCGAPNGSDERDAESRRGTSLDNTCTQCI